MSRSGLCDACGQQAWELLPVPVETPNGTRTDWYCEDCIEPLLEPEREEE